MSRRWRGYLTPWIRIIVGGTLLAVIWSRVGVNLDQVPWSAGLGLSVLAASGLLVAAQFLSSIRWRLLVGADPPPLGYLFRLYLISGFVSIFLPTTVGGDAMRALAASRALRDPGRGVAGVLLDRLLGVLALAGYFLLGMVLGLPRNTSAGDVRWHGSERVLPAVGVGLIGIGVLLLLSPSLRARLASFATDALRHCRTLAAAPGALAVAGLTSLAVQGTYIVTWAVVAAGAGLSVPASLLILGVPLVSLAAMAPITFSGLGVREGAWLLLLRPLGYSASVVVLFSLLYFVAFVLAGAVGGALFIARGTDPPHRAA